MLSFPGSRQLSFAKEGFTEASLGLLANQRRRQLLTELLKSLRTIKTLVTAKSPNAHCCFAHTFIYVMVNSH